MRNSQSIQEQQEWSYMGGTDPNVFRRIMSNLSVYVRNRQYSFFSDTYNPSSLDTIIDVGVSPDSTLKDTNFFEQKYPYKKKLSVASIEDCHNIVTRYHLARFITITPNGQLKVKNKSFDYVVSWATLEHVGSTENQKKFIQELCRIGKHVFITTPDRYSIYEPHTVLFFLHWLPKNLFRRLLQFIGKTFWAEEENWNMLSTKDVEIIIKDTPLKIKKFKMFGFLPSHILIYGDTSAKKVHS